MKYIKLFESHQDKSEYYTEITETEYDNLLDEEGNYVWESDFKIITDLIKGYGLKIRYTSNSMTILDQSNDQGNIDIDKLSDEWYIVNIFSLNPTPMTFVKCDQVEGLIELLKDIIPDIFF